MVVAWLGGARSRPLGYGTSRQQGSIGLLFRRTIVSKRVEADKSRGRGIVKGSKTLQYAGRVQRSALAFRRRNERIKSSYKPLTYKHRPKPCAHNPSGSDTLSARSNAGPR